MISFLNPCLFLFITFDQSDGTLCVFSETSVDVISETTIMTVRRYSANCSLAGVSERERGPERERRCTTSGWRRLEQEIQLQNNICSNSTSGEEDLVPSRCSLQEYVHKNRSGYIK